MSIRFALNGNQLFGDYSEIAADLTLQKMSNLEAATDFKCFVDSNLTYSSGSKYPFLSRINTM